MFLQHTNPKSRHTRPTNWLLQRVILLAAIVIGLGALTPAGALAAENDSNVDARLVGYPSGKKVALEKASATPYYLLFFALVVIGCIPMFKNAKRE